LLQTVEYARAIFDATLPPVPPAVAEVRLQVRLERQRILTREDPPAVRVVLNESALRRTLGRPDVHAAQLAALLGLASRQFIQIHVLPLDRTHLVVAHSFTILGFEKDPSLAYIDSPAGGALIEGQGVDEYLRSFEQLKSAALDMASSREMIKERRNSYQNRK
jgi:hypothetical protein